MVKLFYSPKWFYGNDIAIDLISLIILAALVYFCIRYYKIKKNAKYAYLIMSFILLAFSFLLKILINFKLYYLLAEPAKNSFSTISYQTFEYFGWWFVPLILFYYLLTLLGICILHSIYQKQTLASHTAIIFFILLTIYFAYPNYQVFHLTLFLLLGMVSYKYMKLYIANNNLSTQFLAYGFSLIALSQIFFILVDMNNQFYVAGELVQLLGYFSLLTSLMIILRHRNEKGKI